jgi:hypothetical protein
MDNNTNGIAYLTIHILSTITNSTTMEGNFSNIGNIQTKKCSWLSVKKTHKINIVCMVLHHRHASAPSNVIANATLAMMASRPVQLKMSSQIPRMTASKVSLKTKLAWPLMTKPPIPTKLLMKL